MHIESLPVYRQAELGKMQTSPVVVPEKIIGFTLILDFFDRCRSLRSLHPFGVPDIFLIDESASSAIDPSTRLCPASSATGSAG